MTGKSLDRLEQHADWILEKIGIEFRGDREALELFHAAGAAVEGERIRFEPGLAKALCSTAPPVFAMHARNPEHTIRVGDGTISMTPGYGSPFVNDLDRGRRYATLKDFQNFVSLGQLSPSIHHSGGTVVEPVDIPVNKRHLDMVYSHIRFATKPFWAASPLPSGLKIA